MCATNLFAAKGYTETTIREIASAVGLKGASIYNHFPSKNAILECILEDYRVYSTGDFDTEGIRAMLRENATPDGILGCLQLAFPENKAGYLLKALCVILQEQHRNLIVGSFISGNILRSEQYLKTVIDLLKELHIIRQDTDPDFWAKTASSLFYAFSNRFLLGVGDNAANFSGMGMEDLLRALFDLMLKTCPESST